MVNIMAAVYVVEISIIGVLETASLLLNIHVQTNGTHHVGNRNKLLETDRHFVSKEIFVVVNN